MKSNKLLSGFLMAIVVAISMLITNYDIPVEGSAVDEGPGQETADLVLHDGAIYTVNEAQPWAEAVAVKDGRITFVGSNQEVQPFIGDETKLIDLQGKMVLPGLHDVHQHPLEAGSSVAGTCILPDNTDPEQMIDLIAKCAPNQIGTNWVLGWGHSVFDLLETERPPIEILDEAVPSSPALMMGQTSHSFWANSKALEAAGIDANSPNPVGGIIVKDETTGEPNGILFDNAGNMLMDLALAPTAELEVLNYEGLLGSLEEIAKNGITSICDARTYWGRNHHKAWLQAEEEGTLTARTILGLWAYPHLDDTEQLATLKSLYSNDPDRLLRISQIKLYSDGIIINTTGALLEPYQLDLGIIPDNRGLNYFEEQRLTNYITELEQTGFDFHIHSLGDRAVREALNAIESASNSNPSPPQPPSGTNTASRPSGRGGRKADGDGVAPRHRLTHLELVDEADRGRFNELGVIADFQVAGDFTLPAHFEENVGLIGSRAYEIIPLRTIYDTGATITLSSDWDVSQMPPFIGMQNALTRGKESLPNLDAAIRAYTINGAYLMRQETRTGSIEVGKFADLIVIDQNLFEISTEQIRNTKVLLTLLEGEEVYRDGSLSAVQRIYLPLTVKH